MQDFETTRFGTISYNPDHVIAFPQGLIGFEDCKSFHLFHNEEGDRVLYYLQSLDDSDVSFTLINPVHLNIDYQIALSDTEISTLEMEGRDDEVTVMLMVYHGVSVEGESITAEKGIRAQTQAPLVINPFTRKAIQKPGLKGHLVFTNIDD